MCNVNISRIALLLVVLLIGTAGMTAAVTAVPDARITVSDVTVSPDAAHANERVTVEATITNSAGSPDPVSLNSVELLARGPGIDSRPFTSLTDTEVRDELTGLGALSPGDSVTITLTTQMESPGEYQFLVRADGQGPEEDVDVEVENESTGENETVTRTIEEDVTAQQRTTVTLLPATVDLDVRALPLEEAIATGSGSQEDGEDGGGAGAAGALGGGNIQDIIGQNVANVQNTEESPPPAESPVLVTLSNAGTVEAERIVVTPVIAGEEGTSFVTQNVPAGEQTQVMIDLGTVDSRNEVTLRVDYDTALGVKQTTTQLTYPPRGGDIRVTDANLEVVGPAEGGSRVRITANIGNAGSGELGGTIASVEAAEGVRPVYPARSFFIGTVGSDDFVATELTAVVNASTATEIPVQVTYIDRGVEYTETITLPYNPAEAESEDGTSGISLLTPGIALLTLTVLGVGGVLRRRYV